MAVWPRSSCRLITHLCQPRIGNVRFRLDFLTLMELDMTLPNHEHLHFLFCCYAYSVFIFSVRKLISIRQLNQITSHYLCIQMYITGTHFQQFFSIHFIILPVCLVIPESNTRFICSISFYTYMCVFKILCTFPNYCAD